MKKIAFINGSPKNGESCSLYLIDYISQRLDDSYEEKLIVNALKSIKDSNKENILKEILSCETIIVVFPLYVDSLPSSVLEILEDLQHYKKSISSEAAIPYCLYGVVNCGFIEGRQNVNALKILENYALAAGFKWCGGIGIGAGEMVRSTQNQIPLKSKPALPVYEALSELTASIKEKRSLSLSSSSALTNYKFPKWFFIFMANRSWISMGNANGLTKKQLYKKPFLLD